MARKRVVRCDDESEDECEGLNVTAIVANHDVMVADSMVSDNVIGFPAQKIFEVNGCLVGGAGERRPLEQFMEHLRKFGPGVLPSEARKDFKNFEALVLTKDRRLYLYDEDYGCYEIVAPATHMAIGNGSRAALCVLNYLKKRGCPMDEAALTGAIDATCGIIMGVDGPVVVKRIADVAPYIPPKTKRKRK
jgi:hypothetical protein